MDTLSIVMQQKACRSCQDLDAMEVLSIWCMCTEILEDITGFFLSRFSHLNVSKRVVSHNLLHNDYTNLTVLILTRHDYIFNFVSLDLDD